MPDVLTAPPAADLSAEPGPTRCDRCVARATHVTMRGASRLVWCDHHYSAHADALLVAGWRQLPSNG